MKKCVLTLVMGVFIALQANSQCTFNELFPLNWGDSRYKINELYQNSHQWKVGKDTLTTSAFKHGLNYFWAVRDKRLYFYSFDYIVKSSCFRTGHVTLNCVANDSGLVAYIYQVDFPANQRDTYKQVVDSLRSMMNKKFVYSGSVDTKTEALDSLGHTLTGEGVCFYFNDEPVISSNLTYAPFVVRGGYLAKGPVTTPANGQIVNQAEAIQYYRIEILFKEEKVHH